MVLSHQRAHPFSVFSLCLSLSVALYAMGFMLTGSIPMPHA